jgi:hypothetical protein
MRLNAIRWPWVSHTATLTITLSCRAFATAAATIVFASAKVRVMERNLSWRFRLISTYHIEAHNEPRQGETATNRMSCDAVISGYRKMVPPPTATLQNSAYKPEQKFELSTSDVKPLLPPRLITAKLASTCTALYRRCRARQCVLALARFGRTFALLFTGAEKERERIRHTRSFCRFIGNLLTDLGGF